MSWLHYLMEANLYLVVFYLCYCLFLNRETHYNLNRAYLLFSCAAAFLLPMLQLGMLKPTPVAVNNVTTAGITLQRVLLIAPATPTPDPVLTWEDALVYAYLIGAGIFLLMLLFKLYQLVRLVRANTAVSDKGYYIVHLNGSNTAFSFFKYLFIGANPQSSATIIRHELVHIRQRHSADIMFIELLKVINWFNPFVYLLQRSMRAVHEYIADEQTASSGSGAVDYSSFLVDNAYGLNGTSVTHSFFNYNLLKKRIIMLNQKRSGKLARLKYLVTVPLCAALLCASTLAFSKSYGWVDLAPMKVASKSFVIKKARKLINAPADTVKNKYYAPSTVKNGKRVRFPLPNPMPYHTSKGYAYSEAYYMDNGKIDILVTLKEKNGYYIDFDKLTAKPRDIQYLKDKYGYVFPEGHYPHLPPPPPPAAPASAENVKLLPPPPPVKPAKPAVPADTSKKLVEVKLLPPAKKKKLQEVKLLPPPTVGENQAPAVPSPIPQVEQTNLTNLPDQITLNGIVLTRKKPGNYDATQHWLLIINGTLYFVSGKAPAGQHLEVYATDSTMVNRNVSTVKKEYGEDAKGAMAFFGKVTAAVVPDKTTSK